jgi:hypothetical protein
MNRKAKNKAKKETVLQLQDHIESQRLFLIDN